MKHYNLYLLKAATQDDNKEIKLFIQEMMELLDLQLPHLNEACSTKDLIEMKKIAHSIKSSALIIGAHSLKNHLEKMEYLKVKAEKHEEYHFLVAEINEVVKILQAELREELSFLH